MVSSSGRLRSSRPSRWRWVDTPAGAGRLIVPEVMTASPPAVCGARGQHTAEAASPPGILPRPVRRGIIRRMSKQRQPKYCYEYPRPALTTDLVVVTTEARPRVLLIRRKRGPFAGRWAIPGGFVDENESLESAARRELCEETGVEADRIEQLHTFGDPGRDPRGHVVSVVYLARLDPRKVKPAAADDAAE